MYICISTKIILIIYYKRNISSVLAQKTGFLYKCNEFTGTIKSSEEGNVFFIKKSELHNYKLSMDFDELFNLINNK